MGNQRQFHSKTRLQSTSTPSVQASSLEPRPFGDRLPLPPSHSETESPSLQAQLERMRRMPSNLHRVQPCRYGSSIIQPKLTVGAPNDVYEQEADRVADQVMSMPDRPTQPPIQREEMPEEEVHTKPLAASITPLVQREAMPEEEEPVQRDAIASIQREEVAEDEEMQMKAIAPSIQREEVAEDKEMQMKAIAPSIQREEMPEDEEVQTKAIASSIQQEEMPEEEELRIKSLGEGRLMREEDENLQTTDTESADATPMGTTSGKSTTNFSVDNKNRAVSGKTLTQAWDSMTNSGTRESASVLPEFKPDPKYEYDESNKVTKVMVNIKETKEMPQWVELNQQCPPIKNEWNRFYSLLDQHEEKHISIDRKHFINVHQKLVGKPQKVAWDTLDKVIETADKENKAYDTSSNHGINEGAKLNAAVQCGVEKRLFRLEYA
jgi:predicted secreted Zn-dependent protease